MKEHALETRLDSITPPYISRRIEATAPAQKPGFHRSQTAKPA
jgi:hypothetical protein